MKQIKKRVYRFGGKTAEGDGKMRELLGGKGANLAEMNLLGMPVPAGFTITTECCTEYYRLGGGYTPELKAEVAAAEKRDKKSVQQLYDDRIAYIENMLAAAKEAHWLYEKFGDGVYADVLGLCKLASLEEIEEKGWSLTPGAYVGVAPVEDDGVDFAERMAEIHRELLSLQAESNDLMDAISKNMKEMGL